MHFDTTLLKEEEYLKSNRTFSYYNVIGERKSFDLEINSLAFTYCQVPIVYKKTSGQQITISYTNGQEKILQGKSLEHETTTQLFARNNTIKKIVVEINA